MLSSVRDNILEGLKCRMVTFDSHMLGSKHTEDYDNWLATRPRLVYGDVLGTEHRTIKQILELREMQVFLLSGKAIGGFNGYATFESLEVLVWNVFQIDPWSVFAFTKEEYNDKSQGTSQSRIRRLRYWNKTFTQLLIKLAVRCPGMNGKCEECFLNRHPATRSGVHHHHQNKRSDHGLDKFAYAECLYIDSYIDQLIKGDGDGLCAGCHSCETRQGK